MDIFKFKSLRNTKKTHVINDFFLSRACQGLTARRVNRVMQGNRGPLAYPARTGSMVFEDPKETADSQVN